MSIDKEIERLKEIIENDKKDKENAKAIIERIKNKFYGYSNDEIYENID